MRMEQRKLDILLFKILFLITGGIVVTQTLGLDSITSYLFLLTFPMTVVLWIRSVRKTVTGWDLLVLLIVMVSTVHVMLNASITSSVVSFSYLKKLIMFIMTLLYLQLCCRMRMDLKVAKFLRVMVEALILYLIVAFFLLNPQIFMLNGRISSYLTFRFNNPNLTGLFLTCLYMLEFPRLFEKEKWFRRLLHILMVLALAVFIVMTQSRNSMLVTAAFTLTGIFLMFRKKGPFRMGRIFSGVVVAIPVLFLLIYILFVYSDWVQEFFGFMVSEGKNLDSRMKIWEPALQYLRRSPVFGVYSQISGGTGISQMHNTHLDVACSYGLPVLGAVCVLLWRWLNQRNQYFEDRKHFMYMLGFAGAIILGMGEAALFSGSLGLYILVGGFLLLANQGAKEDEKYAESGISG